jgi:hypothetical protein
MIDLLRSELYAAAVAERNQSILIAAGLALAVCAVLGNLSSRRGRALATWISIAGYYATLAAVAVRYLADH